jgi:hypothetical protein
MIDDNIIAKLLRALVEDLVHGNYEEIKKKGRAGRLSREEIKEAIDDYPGKITLPPEESFKKFHRYEYDKNNEDEEGCLIEYELWYDQQESDLTLSATIVRNSQGMRIGIEDIHVL